MPEIKKTYSKQRVNGSELGQSVVIFALVIFALVAAVGLAIDGGNALNKRRITQNAADASALGGVHYIAVANSPTEQRLLENINTAVEANDIPDTDLVPGNHINSNVTVYYTDSEGDRLVPPNCNIVGTCGGTPPLQAFGLEVDVRNLVDTYFIRVIGIDTVKVAAGAVAVASGLFPESLREAALLALSDTCTLEDKPIDGSGSETEILGLVHTNSSFFVSGQDNHFHGQVSYVGSWNEDDNPGPPAPPKNLFEPDRPDTGKLVHDPFAHLNVNDFAPGQSAVLGVDPLDYHNVSTPTLGKVDVGVLQDLGLYNPITSELKDGVYYAGDLQIDLSDQGMHGEVTLVTSNMIVTGGSDLNLTAYMEDPALLMFSDYKPGVPCKDAAIDLGGSSGTIKPQIFHEEEDLDYPGCPEDPVEPEDVCYVPSSNIFSGLIYAPRGKVYTSGSKSTIQGAIVAYTIKLNGSNELVINNPELFPAGVPMINLDE